MTVWLKGSLRLLLEEVEKEFGRDTLRRALLTGGRQKTTRIKCQRLSYYFTESKKDNDVGVKKKPSYSTDPYSFSYTPILPRHH